jgi:hypothetical protein
MSSLVEELRAESAVLAQAEAAGPKVTLLCGCVGSEVSRQVVAWCPYASQLDSGAGRDLHLYRWTLRTAEANAHPEQFQLTGCPPCMHCQGTRTIGKHGQFSEERWAGTHYECPDCGSGWTVREGDE